MNFEYNPDKSKSNRGKHGISLEEAKQLWLVRAAVVDAHQRFEESRHMIIGKIENKFYSAIFTMRDETIRLISARRSSKKEIKIYHETIG